MAKHKQENYTPLETFTFLWSRNFGDCLMCGNPAAFGIVDYYGENGPLARFCGICAANEVAVGGYGLVFLNPELRADDED